MKYLNYLHLLGLICLFLLENANSWLPPSGMSLFDALDMNKDGIITQEEGLTNPSKAVARKWVTLLEKIPKSVVERGITRKKFYDLSSTMIFNRNEGTMTGQI